MDRITYCSLVAGVLCFTQGALAYSLAPSTKPWYISANAGMFEGTFNAKYTDRTDPIALNIADTIQQKGYTGGLGIGYSRIICQTYLLGAELSGGWMSNQATYQSGSATSAFTDKMAMENYIDFVFVPGVFFTQSLAGYLKIGVSRAQFSDHLNSPTDYTPQFVNINTTKHATGFTTSLGLQKWLTSTLSLFAEYNYRDYGTISFPNFQNFTATYSHAGRAYGQSILLGLNYQIF